MSGRLPGGLFVRTLVENVEDCGTIDAELRSLTRYEIAIGDFGRGGEVTLRSLTTADFHDSAGNSAHFVISTKGPDIAVCS